MVEAEDGLIALERYSLDRPDVVLLDLVMKGMYGLDVLAKLIQLDPDASRPGGVRRRAGSSHVLVAEAGAKGFVNKPFDREQILQRPGRGGDSRVA